MYHLSVRQAVYLSSIHLFHLLRLETGGGRGRSLSVGIASPKQAHMPLSLHAFCNIFDMHSSHEGMRGDRQADMVRSDVDLSLGRHFVPFMPGIIKRQAII